MRDFSVEYHQRVKSGQAPAAFKYDAEGGEEEVDDVATVLADGIIDVTPTKKQPVRLLFFSWVSPFFYVGVIYEVCP